MIIPMPIPNAYRIVFSGPNDTAGTFVDHLRQNGLAAESCPSMYPDNPNEAHLGWVQVLTHEGQDAQPSLEFMQRIDAKADQIAQDFDFRRRSHGFCVAANLPFSS